MAFNEMKSQVDFLSISAKRLGYPCLADLLKFNREVFESLCRYWRQYHKL